MSCTDDKTPCPCEPELRRFEAADLKAAVLNGQSSDEIEDDGGEGWYALESGVQAANELHDPEHQTESLSLYQAWNESGRHRGREFNAEDAAKRDAAYLSYREHYEANRGTINPTKIVPFTFKWNGKELTVEVVQDNGGTEGGGEQAHMIYKVCDRLFRLDGSYYSYDGTTWDDDSFREVQAVTKAVVFYE